MSNYNCLTMMILRKCRANYEELTSLINKSATFSASADSSMLLRIIGIKESICVFLKIFQHTLALSFVSFFLISSYSFSIRSYRQVIQCPLPVLTGYNSSNKGILFITDHRISLFICLTVR